MAIAGLGPRRPARGAWGHDPASRPPDARPSARPLAKKRARAGAEACSLQSDPKDSAPLAEVYFQAGAGPGAGRGCVRASPGKSPFSRDGDLGDRKAKTLIFPADAPGAAMKGRRAGEGERPSVRTGVPRGL